MPRRSAASYSSRGRNRYRKRNSPGSCSPAARKSSSTAAEKRYSGMRRTNSIPAASELLGSPATPVSGELDLKTAQSEIAVNWIEAYKKYVSKSPPTPIVRETKPVAATSTATLVWVNTRSGRYWKPGSRFYGKTKQGEFMSALDALDRGYSPGGGTGR
jgi:hypothetical protein